VETKGGAKRQAESVFLVPQMRVQSLLS
jgi:hypothetical protein